MLKGSDITIEELCAFSERSMTLLTIDAPLFGSVMILNGRQLPRGYNIVIPPTEEIVREASRFWIQHSSGVRVRKCREEMVILIDDMRRSESGRSLEGRAGVKSAATS